MGKYVEILSLIGLFDLNCLQETWLNPSIKFSLKDYNVFRSDRVDLRLGGGSMIVCKKSLNPKVHIINSNIFPNCDIVIVSILDSKLCRDRLFFVSFYKLPNINFKINHWRELFKRINSISLSAQTFILGDFNAQNNIWDSTVNNPSRITLGKFLLEISFYFLNNGEGMFLLATIRMSLTCL